MPEISRFHDHQTIPLNRILPASIVLVAFLAGIALGQAGTSMASEAPSRYLSQLGGPPASREIAVEEFVNYHRHRIATLKAGESVALDLRWASDRTFARGHEAILQVGISTALVRDRQQLRPLNLALVIDRSGSMGSEDKMTRVKTALRMMVRRLSKQDSMSIVTFDTNAEVLLPSAPRLELERAQWCIQYLQPAGSTNLHAGLMPGYAEDGPDSLLLRNSG